MRQQLRDISLLIDFHATAVPFSLLFLHWLLYKSVYIQIQSYLVDSIWRADMTFEFSGLSRRLLLFLSLDVYVITYVTV